MLVEKLKLYRPLLFIFGASLLAALSLSMRLHGDFSNMLMGLFLLFLAVLQSFDLAGFAMSFRRYDMLAARSTIYARGYPLLEAILGSCYLGGFLPLATNIVMACIMSIGIAGVWRAMRRGEKMQCACAGTAFALPVGRVTLFENAAMGAMAAWNLAALLTHSNSFL